MEDYLDLKATLEWAAELRLTDEQRKSLERLCCRIGGCIPRGQLIDERKARQAAQKRVAELEAAMKSKRDEFVFRRRKPQKSAIPSY